MENQNDKDKRYTGLPCDGDQGERQRPYIVADAGSQRRQQDSRGASRHETADGREGWNGSESDSNHVASGNSPARLLADAAGDGSAGGCEGEDRSFRQGESRGLLELEGSGADRGELGDTDSPGPSRLGEDGGQGEAQGRLRCGPCNGFWSSAVWLPCRDGKARPVEPCVEPMADGIAGDLGLVRLESYPDHPHKERIIYAPLIQKGKARVGRLRGYGNAIVCPVATEFIRAYMESKC